MAFLIRTVDYTAAGREIVRERQAAERELTIGRAAENDIHLPDLAVEQRHVGLREEADGTLEISALGTLGFGIDGRTETSARVPPGQGAELALGSSRLTLAREDSGTSITIRQVEKTGGKDVLRGFALSSALPSKRAMSWAFAAAVVIALLAIPIVTHLTRDPIENDPGQLATGQVAMDSTWSTGPLSKAHHALEENCEACHAMPFVSVQDETCLTCHEEIGDHAALPRLAGGMPPFSRGDAIQWKIAETLGKEGPLGCVACHTEHEGPLEQAAAPEKFCADCHEALDTRLTDTELANAHDFGDQHPQFRPAFYDRLGAKKPIRASLAKAPTEMSGLKFPHDVHLDENGGAARMAISLGRYGAPLECSDCHEPSQDRIGFAPVEMESSCESCHSLVSGRSGAGFTKLTHGNVEAMRAELARVNRGPRRAMVSGRTRPGQFAEGKRYYSDFGRPFGAYMAISNALGPKGICGECHIPTTTRGMPDVIPVNLPDRFLWNGHFSHAAHEGEDCSTCHAADTSGTSNDLLLPEIKVCRDCHLGETAAATDQIVPSGCAMCHSYHSPARPWSPERRENPGPSPTSLAALLERIRR